MLCLSLLALGILGYLLVLFVRVFGILFLQFRFQMHGLPEHSYA